MNQTASGPVRALRGGCWEQQEISRWTQVQNVGRPPQSHPNSMDRPGELPVLAFRKPLDC